MDRGHAVMRNFVDVKRELRLHMLAPAFCVVDLRAKLGEQLGELDWNREVDRLQVSYRVADVVRKRAHRKGQLIGILRIAEEVHDKVARAHIVRQV